MLKTYSASLMLRISNAPSPLGKMPMTRTAGNTHRRLMKTWMNKSLKVQITTSALPALNSYSIYCLYEASNFSYSVLEYVLYCIISQIFLYIYRPVLSNLSVNSQRSRTLPCISLYAFPCLAQSRLLEITLL